MQYLEFISELKLLNQNIMKRLVCKRIVWSSVLSIGIIAFFLFLALGSLYTEMAFFTPKKSVESLGGRVVKTTYVDPMDDDRDSTIYVGTRDFFGNYYGLVTIKHIFRGYLDYTEEINYIDGKKHGKATAIILYSC